MNRTLFLEINCRMFYRSYLNSFKIDSILHHWCANVCVCASTAGSISLSLYIYILSRLMGKRREREKSVARKTGKCCWNTSCSFSREHARKEMRASCYPFLQVLCSDERELDLSSLLSFFRLNNITTIWLLQLIDYKSHTHKDEIDLIIIEVKQCLNDDLIISINRSREFPFNLSAICFVSPTHAGNVSFDYLVNPRAHTNQRRTADVFFHWLSDREEQEMYDL